MLSGCGATSNNTAENTASSDTPPMVTIDTRCDDADYPSEVWTECEANNYAKTTEAPLEQLLPDFNSQLQAKSLSNTAEWTQRSLDDPSWLSPQSGNSSFTPLCTTWAEQCAGDPFRYPDAPGPNGAAFYETEADVIPVLFYDQGCARISGRIWAPKGAGRLPGIVIENGSVQAPEPLYWWAAQMFVRAGYTVMTFDPRGQGRSDQQTPTGEQGSNANSTVFWDGLVNAIDFFRSTEAQPYPHNESCADTYPTQTTAFNPLTERLDFERLGIAGHSLGGTGVSVVQSYGADGAEPWPGLIDSINPVDAVVAWDGIANVSDGSGSSPAVVPHKPIMGQNSEYGLVPAPFTSPPDAESGISALLGWQAAGVPAFEITVQGSSHYEWSQIPTFPTTSWCPDASEGICDGGWGNALGRHYTLAWMDRWLKLAGEPGYADADQRLLNDDGENGRNKFSFRFVSGRDYVDRQGLRHVCLDIRTGC